ncbi:MAG: HNH endonuclease [Desulfopila sp.]
MDLRKTRWWQRKTASGECFYCGTTVAFKNITMDHVVPLTRGGKSTKENLVPCCKKCNTAKKTMMPLEWQDYLEKIQQKKQ